ncbi:protein of unknown function [Pseudomonas sp. JV241A]|nr:protein of unknown function [Pseudomonas sp. JV241A]
MGCDRFALDRRQGQLPQSWRSTCGSWLASDEASAANKVGGAWVTTASRSIAGKASSHRVSAVPVGAVQLQQYDKQGFIDRTLSSNVLVNLD